MCDIDDGGPAFAASPTVGANGDLYRPVDIGCEGMSLRDYFAGQALIGELSAQTEESGHFHPDGKALADRCYTFADAMIQRRKEGRSNG